jgi:hypothetical protein
MPYITVSDVVNAAPGIDISAQSRPNIGQVQGFIVERERDLDSTLSPYFQTPITGTQSLALVKRVLKHQVLADVLRAKAYGQSNPRDIGADTADAQAKGIIDRILDPADEFTLVDAVPKVEKGTAVEGAEAIEGSTSLDYDVPITRYTRF